MKRTVVFMSLLLTCGIAAAHVSDCVQPTIPEMSASKEGVRRVAKQVKDWRSCSLKMADQEEAGRMDAEVESSLEKWLAATRQYAEGQARSGGAAAIQARDMARFAADRSEYNRQRERARVRAQ